MEQLTKSGTIQHINAIATEYEYEFQDKDKDEDDMNAIAYCEMHQNFRNKFTLNTFGQSSLGRWRYAHRIAMYSSICIFVVQTFKQNRLTQGNQNN